MRLGLSVLAAAALSAGVATAVVAQTQNTPTNPNTKVLAYKKTAPSPMSPVMSADPTSMPRQRPLEHLMPDSAPYGSAAWWQEIGRTAGGGDGGGQ
jgi:hypothetical protein